MTSIKTKLLLVLCAMALAPLLTFGAISYLKTTETFTETVLDYLRTIVKAKENALENYIGSTETIGQAIAASDAVQRYIALADQAATGGDTTSMEQAKAEVASLLYSFQEAHWGKYHHIFLIDRSKHIAVSPNHGAQEKGSPSSHLGEDTSRNRWAMRALRTGETTVSDYSSWAESDHTHQMLFYPVKNADGATRAVIGFELQIPYETRLLTEDFQLGETGSVFLLTEKGVPIVYKDIDKQKPLHTTGFFEAKEHGFSSGVRKNARGVEVLDLYLKHEKYPWILVAEIETAEAFRSLHGVQRIFLIALGLTLAAAALFSLFFSNLIVRPIRKLTEQMEQVSLGRFDVEITGTGRTDEIGKLIQAFQRMVVSLQIAMKQIKQAKPPLRKVS